MLVCLREVVFACARSLSRLRVQSYNVFYYWPNIFEEKISIKLQNIDLQHFIFICFLSVFCECRYALK